jgi:exodeoxyribonuclease VII small subunit
MFYHNMKKEIIDICTKFVAGILVTVGIFAAVPMIMLAMDIIGVRMAPEGMNLPFAFKRLGLDALEASDPSVLTTYVVTLATAVLAAIYALLHAIGRVSFNFAPMKRIEQIVSELEQSEALSMDTYQAKAKEAKLLLTFCQQQLTDWENKMQDVIATLE